MGGSEPSHSIFAVVNEVVHFGFALERADENVSGALWPEVPWRDVIELMRFASFFEEE